MGGHMDRAWLAEKIKAVMLGHAVADALGVPVEFSSRAALDAKPLTDMIGFGTYPYPAGSWSDDTSMSLASLDSLCSGRVDWEDTMERFGEWYYRDGYTPTGSLFDIGGACLAAIENYFVSHRAPTECGLSGERSNGNGSLMRIHPYVLYAAAKGMTEGDSVSLVHDASALTHAHKRSKIGCGIYAFILLRLLADPRRETVARALSEAADFYRDEPELSHYSRLFDRDFAFTAREKIKSSGYVVDTLEAAIWCLLSTESYRDCVLAAANLGEDTDTVAAVSGGLAGALYGYGAIPDGWLCTLARREYIEEMCDRAAEAWL